MAIKLVSVTPAQDALIDKATALGERYTRTVGLQMPRGITARTVGNRSWSMPWPPPGTPGRAPSPGTAASFVVADTWPARLEPGLP